jgi:hypothetical protein
MLELGLYADGELTGILGASVESPMIIACHAEGESDHNKGKKRVRAKVRG